MLIERFMTIDRKKRGGFLRLMSTVGMIFFFCTLISAGGAASLDSGAEEMYFTILHTNDEHSAIIPRNPAVDYHPEKENRTVGGFARLAGLVAQIRAEKQAEEEPVVLVSAGDYIGGTIYSWLIPAGHAPEISLMQQIGYDVAIIGNHEFDYGPIVLADYLRQAGYPEAHSVTTVLGSNLDIPEGHPLHEADLPKTRLKVLDNGLKIGFFSLLGHDASDEAPNMYPVGVLDDVTTALECVDRLQKQGADVIVAVTHAGEEADRALARRVPGIHLIVGGHSHLEIHEPIQEGDTFIVQTGHYLKYLGMVELAYNPATGKVRLRNREAGNGFLVPIDHTVSPDWEIQAAVDEYTTILDGLITEYTDGKYDHIMDTVLKSPFTLYASRFEFKESGLGNFVTDAMRLIVEKKTGQRVDFAFQGNGVIRSAINPGSYAHSKNKISLYDFLEPVSLGFGEDDVPGYPLALAYLNTEEIYKILEISTLLAEYMGSDYFLHVSGLRYEFDPARAILFWIPGTDIPVPSTRAVLRAEKYTGDSVQRPDSDNYVPLQKRDDDLHSVVTDYALLSAIPLVAEKIPWLRIVPKNEKGEPVEDFTEMIIRIQDEELKVWQAVLAYAAKQPVGEDGYLWVDDYYRGPVDRIVAVKGPNIFIWPAIILTIVIILLTFLIVRRVRLKRRSRFAVSP